MLKIVITYTVNNKININTPMPIIAMNTNLAESSWLFIFIFVLFN